VFYYVVFDTFFFKHCLQLFAVFSSQAAHIVFFRQGWAAQPAGSCDLHSFD
jgi:hypothetical protein